MPMPNKVIFRRGRPSDCMVMFCGGPISVHFVRNFASAVLRDDYYFDGDLEIEGSNALSAPQVSLYVNNGRMVLYERRRQRG